MENFDIYTGLYIFFKVALLMAGISFFAIFCLCIRDWASKKNREKRIRETGMEFDPSKSLLDRERQD